MALSIAHKSTIISTQTKTAYLLHTTNYGLERSEKSLEARVMIKNYNWDATPIPLHKKRMDNSEKSYNVIQQKLLDNLRLYPYHDTEAIYLSSQSLQWINDKKLRVFGVSLFKFLHYVYLTSF